MRYISYEHIVYIMNIPTSIEDECPICLVAIHDVDMYTPCCNKRFHKACYDKWMSTNSNCPLCRTEQLLPEGLLPLPEVRVQMPVNAPPYECQCYLHCSNLRGMLFSIVGILVVLGFVGLMAWCFITKNGNSTMRFPPPSHS